MGLTCSLFRATSTEIQRIIDDPETLDDFVESVEGNAPKMREYRPKGFLGLLLRLTPIRIEEPVPDDESQMAAPDPARCIDIDKGWHGLHFLLTGKSEGGDEPACYLTAGGETLDEDGCFHVLRPEQVCRFAQHLSALDPAELERRFEPVRMAKLEIYPDAIWTSPASGGESPLAWLLGLFSEVSSFMTNCARVGDGVIIRIA